MQNHKTKPSIKETLLLFSYTIYLIVNFLSWSSFNIPSFVLPLTNVATSLLLIIGILSGTKMTLKHLMIAFVLVLLCFIVSIISSDTTGLIVMILFIICAKDMDYQKIIRRYFVVGIIMLCLILTLYFMGFFEISRWARIETSGEKFYRYSMGFEYTTFGPLLFMCSVFAYLSIKKDEINLIETIVILIINYFFNYWTNTRAVYYLMLCAIVLFWIKKRFPFVFDNKVCNIVCVAITPILAIISLALPMIDANRNSWVNKIDPLFSDRIRLGQEAISKYGISSLFGNNITWAGAEKGDLVDSSYLRVLLEYGWIMLILIVVGFMIVQALNCSKKNYGLVIIISLYMIHSITDPQLLSISGNPFLLLLGSILNKNTSKAREMKPVVIYKHKKKIE